MQGQAREKIQHLNDLLQRTGWIGDEAIRLTKIRKKLSEVEWLSPKQETRAIQSFYKDEIDEIKTMVAETGGRFTEMENQLHEFRRDLRWLSIYPQALRGMIQLTKTDLADDRTQKYLVDEIVHSKYNVMPDAGENEWFLLLEKNYFFDLSWVIAETGKLKDDGLQFFAVTEALQQTEGLNHHDALNKSFGILGVDTNRINNILQDASQIVNEFMKEQNLDKLVYGLGHISSAKK
jgi:hypothetical protein